MCKGTINSFILAGGLGTRIKFIFPSLEKFLTPVNDIPFYTYIVNGLSLLGIKTFVLNTKSLKLHKIKLNYFSDNFLSGNAGGFLTSLSKNSKLSVISNCDSLLNFFKNNFFIKKIFSKPSVFAIVSLESFGDTRKFKNRYGYVFRNNNFIHSFFEKTSLAGHISFSSGVYISYNSLIKSIFFKNILLYNKKL
jgi:NDP-sugar pyrophosphorylase family protein